MWSRACRKCCATESDVCRENTGDVDAYEVPLVTEIASEPVRETEYAGYEGYVPVTDYRQPVARPERIMREAVVDVVKRVGGSPLFLIGVIAFTIQLIVAMIPAKLGLLETVAPILNYMSMANVSIPYEVIYVVETLDSYGWGVRLIINLIANVPAIIVCIGLWVAFSSAKSKRNPGMKTGGLTTIKVVNIYQIVVASISFAIVELILIIGIIASANLYSAYDGYFSSGATAAMWISGIVAVLLAVVFVLVILYYSKIVKSINNVKKAIAMDSTEYKASVFVAVWLIIAAVFSVGTIFVSFVSTIATIIYLICFSVAIFEYNRSVKRLASKRERMIG